MSPVVGLPMSDFHLPLPLCLRPVLRQAPVRAVALALLVLSLAACSHTAVRNPLAQWVPSENRDARRPQLIVLHYTDQESAEQSLKTLRTRNSKGRVSAHYLIGIDGRRYQLVADSERAWHAGAGRWGTIPEVNSASIGIEIDNNGHSPYPQAQIESLIVLLRDLTQRLGISPTQVIGHSDLAPTRKIDPGPLFPWKQLAEAGFGVWPDLSRASAPPAGFDPWLALQSLGYAVDDRAAVVRAFHHHFRGMEGTELDAEDLRILYVLTFPPGESIAQPAAQAHAEGDQ